MDEEHNNNNNNNREDAMMEDGDEAFVDLDDPNYEVLEEHEEDEQGSDEDEIDANNNNNNNMQTNNEEEDGGDDASPGAEVEDLNVVPDREPERDDALAFFVAPEQHPLHSIAVHPNDANLFAVAGEGETIYILRRTPDGANNNDNNNMSGVVCEHVLTGHTDTISLLSFSPNGAWLASGGLDAHVMLWNTNTWTCTHSLSDLYGEILSLLWHPSSLVLIATADDAQAAMWSVAKGTLAMFFVGHRGPITCVTWTSDNMKLLTGSSDGTVMIFSPKTGEQLVNVAKDLSPDTAGVTAMCFITEDQCVVGCEDGTLHIVSVRAGKVANHLEDIHEQAIEALVMNRVGSLLLSAGCDGKVVLWSTSDLSPRSVLEVGESIITALWLDHRVVAGCGDGVVRVWDGRSSEEEPQSILMGHRRMILRMAPSSTNDGGASVVATASDDGSMRIFAIPSVGSA